MNFLNIKLGHRTLPIYQQVATALREAIQKGILAAGEALPSARTLAHDLAINRHTVRIAYEELVSEGWIRAQERVGYFVAQDFPSFAAPTLPIAASSSLEVLKQALDRQCPTFDRVDTIKTQESLANIKFNLQSSVPDLRLLPSAELRSCFARSLRHLPQHLDYSGTRGEPLLLEVLTKMVRQGRQLIQHEIILTQGSQEAIFMTASLLLRPGKVVAVEAKGYQPAWRCFQYFGAELIPIQLDHEGLCPADLERVLRTRTIDLLYLTPLHQFPTTVSLTPSRRARIMALLKQYKVPLLEDDYDHDVHFDSLPPLPMAAQDPHQLVIYVSTLSKLIFPGARLGFMAVPAAVLPRFLQLKVHSSRVNETFAARAVGLWIEDGGFERHLWRLRRTYQKRLESLLQKLESSAFFRDHCTWIPPKGGTNLWLNIGVHPQKIYAKAQAKGLLLSGEDLYLLNADQSKAQHLRLGFAALNEIEMGRALKLLQDAMQGR